MSELVYLFLFCKGTFFVIVDIRQNPLLTFASSVTHSHQSLTFLNVDLLGTTSRSTRTWNILVFLPDQIQFGLMSIYRDVILC